MIDLAEGVLREFAERAHPLTRVARSGCHVERSRPSWPDVQIDRPCWVSRFEAHRKIVARIDGRRAHRRRMVWVPT